MMHFLTCIDKTLANWVRCRGCGEGVYTADWQPEHISWLAAVHSPATCNILRPGGISHASKLGVSWLKQCRGQCWWKTSEQEFKGASWQECNGMTRGKRVEHAACISTWKTTPSEVKRLSCFAYNLRKEDPAKEDRRYQKQVIKKRWQWQCAFCRASSAHLRGSCGPSVAALQLWSCMTPCVRAQRTHHICNQSSWEKKPHCCRKGNCASMLVLSWRQEKLVSVCEGYEQTLGHTLEQGKA